VKGGSRVFDPQDPDLKLKIAEFHPSSIAGAYADVLSLAGVAQPTHSVTVFVSDNELSQAQRDELWLCFAVPVFEQIRTADGELVATECEAHNGLHYVEGAGDFETCECGRPMLRAACAVEHAMCAAAIG